MRLIIQVKEQTFSGHNDSVDQLCWHETNPDLLSTASGDKTMRVWDARIKKNIATVNTKGICVVKFFYYASSQPFVSHL